MLLPPSIAAARLTGELERFGRGPLLEPGLDARPGVTSPPPRADCRPGLIPPRALPGLLLRALMPPCAGEGARPSLTFISYDGAIGGEF